MSAPIERTLNYGLRYASVLTLNEHGSPAAVDETPYEGIQFRGSTAFELNVPDSRKLSGLGEDNVTQVVYLPPNEGIDGKLNVEATDPVLSTALDGTKIRTEGEMSIVGLGTNKQGFEPQVGMLLYQAAKGLETGKTYWHSYLLPSAQAVKKSHGMNAEKGVTVYQIAPNKTTKHIWEEKFTDTVEGFLNSQVLEIWSNYPPRVTAFVGDNTTTEFLFPVDFPSVTIAAIKVYVNGVAVAGADFTPATDGITFDVAPATGARIVVLRDYAG